MMDIVLKIVTVLLFLVVFKHSFEAWMALVKARVYITEKYGKVTLFLMFLGILVITLLEYGLFYLFVKHVIFNIGE